MCSKEYNENQRFSVYQKKNALIPNLKTKFFYFFVHNKNKRKS